MNLCTWTYAQQKPFVNFSGLHVPNYQRRMTMAESLRNVSAVFGFSIRELKSPCRNRKLAYARFAACLIMREKGCKSYTEIGRFLKRDHSSIIHACQRANELIANDPGFASAYKRACHG